jgi:hypothetical protein
MASAKCFYIYHVREKAFVVARGRGARCPEVVRGGSSRYMQLLEATLEAYAGDIPKCNSAIEMALSARRSSGGQGCIEATRIGVQR